MDLMSLQSELQKEAHEVLERLDLMRLLEKIGTPFVVGSVELGLMTWRDIDFEIVVSSLDKSKIVNLARELLERSERRLDLTLMDNRSQGSGKDPKGFYLNLKYYGMIPEGEQLLGSNKKAWKMDLWFVEETDARSYKNTQVIKEKLTEDSRKIILELKEEMVGNPKYRYEIFSTDIYEGVLSGGVKNMEDFKAYLKGIGKEI